VLKRGGRELPTGEAAELEPSQAVQADLPELKLEEKSRNAVLWQEFQRLSERCFQLLRLLLADPAPSYLEVGAALDMKIGSIGPTRARCLAELRRRMELAGISSRSDGS
jgi:DNA-directed RNA polymerase specialized sigma24 family protein